MNILVISDEKSKALWDYFEPARLNGIDLILSCGDLPAEYLSFLATFTHAPVLYVHGNHDDRYELNPPEGCFSVDDAVYVHKGIRIAGLGGSMMYKEGKHMFTEWEMKKRVFRLIPKLLRCGGVDILLTHSPAYHLGDDTDLPHTGFKAFYMILDRFKPKYLIHGHVHLNYGKIPRVQTYKETMVINGFESYKFSYEDGKQI